MSDLDTAVNPIMALHSLCQNNDQRQVHSELQCKNVRHKSLCAACSDIATIDMQTTQTTNKLFQLQLECLEILPRGNAVHDMMTFKLPVEICAKIFLETLPDIEKLDEKSHSCLLSAPLILSWVCRHWREMAHNSSDLWTQMALSLHAAQKLENVSTLVEEWLKRGGNTRPLSIVLSIDPLFAESHSQSSYIGVILKLLMRHSHRFIFFSIAATAYHMNQLSFQQHLAANLQSLHLNGLTVKGAREAVWLCNPKPRPTFLTLRNLRWSQLVDTNTTAPPDSTGNPAILIDLNVLNILTVAKLELEDCLALFRLAPAIKSCTISLLGEFNSTGAFDSRIRRLPNTPPPVLYEALEELTLLDLTTEHSQFILNAYNFPSLRKFTSTENKRRYGQTYGVIHALKNHIRRAGVELVSLCLNNLRCHGNIKPLVQDLISVAGPSLVDLVLEHLNYMHENPLQVIEGIFQNLSHLPELRSIRVYSPANEWMHSLHGLVTFAHRLAVYNRQHLSVALTTTPDFYSDGTFKDVINRDQVLDMLATMRSGFITTRLLQGRLTEGLWNPDVDVTADIVVALSRMNS